MLKDTERMMHDRGKKVNTRISFQSSSYIKVPLYIYIYNPYIYTGLFHLELCSCSRENQAAVDKNLMVVVIRNAFDSLTILLNDKNKRWLGEANLF